MVKLQVPFLLSAAQDAVPNAPCAALLDAEQTLLHPTSKGERNGGMEFCPVCPEPADRDLADASAFSGATWLALSNPVARTEYHRRLVLSILFPVFSKIFLPATVSPFVFCILPKERLQSPGKIHLLPLAFCCGSCYYNNATFCGQGFQTLYNL